MRWSARLALALTLGLAAAALPAQSATAAPEAPAPASGVSAPTQVAPKDLIAYVCVQGGAQICVIDPDDPTAGPTRVTDSAGSFFSPTWSPDGRYLAFSVGGGMVIDPSNAIAIVEIDDDGYPVGRPKVVGRGSLPDWAAGSAEATFSVRGVDGVPDNQIVWAQGDEYLATGRSVRTSLRSTEGVSEVGVTVDAGGRRSSATGQIRFGGSPSPVADYEWLYVSGKPDEIAFNRQAAGVPIDDVVWDFGFPNAPQGEATEGFFTVPFPGPGTYQVNLSVRGELESTQTQTIIVGGDPSAPKPPRPRVAGTLDGPRLAYVEGEPNSKVLGSRPPVVADGRREIEDFVPLEDPEWVGDTDSLVYARRSPRPGDLDLYLDGVNITHGLEYGQRVGQMMPAVSRDARRIAYSSCVESFDSGRCVLNTTQIEVGELNRAGDWEINEARVVVRPVTDEGKRREDVSVLDPSWSPDGTRIAYSLFGGAADAGIWVASPDEDGGQKRRIQGTGPRDRSPAWRPPVETGDDLIQTLNASTGKVQRAFRTTEAVDVELLGVPGEFDTIGSYVCITHLPNTPCGDESRKQGVPAGDLPRTFRYDGLPPGRYFAQLVDGRQGLQASWAFSVLCGDQCERSGYTVHAKAAAATGKSALFGLCSIFSAGAAFYELAQLTSNPTLAGLTGFMAQSTIIGSALSLIVQPLPPDSVARNVVLETNQVLEVIGVLMSTVATALTGSKMSGASVIVYSACQIGDRILQAIVDDPPDPNFTVEQRTTPDAVSPSDGTPVDDARRSLELATRHLADLFVSLERAQGAEAGGAPESEVRQLAIAQASATDLARVYSDLATSAERIAFELDATSMGSRPFADAETERRAREVREQFGTIIGPSERDALIAAGLTPSEIDAMVSGVESGSTDPALFDGTATAALREGIDDLRVVAQEFRAASVQLGAARAAVLQAPLVDDRRLEVQQNTSEAIVLDAFDPYGGVPTYEVLTQPAHGTLTGTEPDLVYTPNAGYLGPDSFTWRATGNLGTSPPATVSIEVLLPAPTAVADDYGTEVSAALQVPAPGVLTNDLAMALPVTAELVTPPAKGSVALRPDGSFTYTPRPTVSGTDRFTYRARTPGSAASAPATVTITLVNANRPPTAVTDLLEIDEDTAGSVDVLANDRDLDGDPLTFTGVRQPRNGAVVCVAAVCTYSPARDFHGSDQFTYTVSDGQGTTSTGTVLVTVRPVQDPPTARDDLVSIEPGQPVTVDVLANDSDPDGDPVTFVAHTDPAQGTATCTAAGVCTYTPVDDTVSADEFTYTVTDGMGNQSQASVLVANEPPMIFSDGPLQLIITGNTLSCSVDYLGDTVGSFFNDVGCGTFLATGGTLYGQTFTGVGLNPPQPREFYEPLNQSRVLGAGTVDDPYRVITRVRAGSSGLELVQTDSYVVGEESYRTDVEIVNPGAAPASAVLYRGGDCNLGDSDTGFGRRDPATGAVACVAADGRILEWLPLSPGSTDIETDPDTFWDAIASQQPFPGTCRCAEDIDNAGGLSWAVTVPAGGSVVRSHRTIFSPFGYRPLLTTMTATPPQTTPAGEVTYTVRVSNPNTTSAAQLSTITAMLPEGFTVVPGSTTGAATAGPSVAGATLTWTGPFTVPADGQVQLSFRTIATTEPGTYRARAGATAANFTVQGTGDTAPVEVLDVVAPFASFVATGPALTLAFDGSSSFDFDGTIVGYAWDFGDGATGVGPTPDHAYATAGEFPVTLTVTDDDGATGTVTRTVRARAPNQAPTAALTSTSTELRATFDGRGSTDPDGTIVAYAWDFGDGTTGWGPLPVHDYAADGTYSVTLTVTDDRGGQASTTQPITVTRPANQPPVAAFTSTPDGLTVAFDGRVSFDPDDAQGTIAAYSWSFGDGGTGTGPTPDHVYSADGVYPVTLTVTDRRGATASTTRDVRVAVARTSNAPPEPVIVPAVDGLVVDVDSAGSQDPDGEIVSYEWEFADQGVIEGPTASFAFLAPGRYPIRLTVTDDDGASAATVVALTVPDDVDPPANQEPTATFAATATFLTVAFDGSGSADPDGTIVSHAWQFGDGATGTGATPVHVYAAAGTYSVTLTVTDDDGATATETTPVTVEAPPPGNAPPTAAFTTTIDDLTVDFDATSSTDGDGTVVSYQWSFGDGATGTGSSPTHVYAAAGTYTVTLVVTDDDGASDVASEPVTVTAPPVPPVAAFLADPSGLTVTFDGSSSVDADGDIVSWQWAFGDGSTGSGADAVHAYAAAGTYQVTLTVTDDDGLTDSTSAPVTVVAPPPGNQLPVALFTAAEDGLTVVIDGSSSTDPDGTVVTWRWDFGDGTTASGSRVTHTFPSSGTRAVTLQVVDDDGGVDSVVVPVTVVTPPDQLLGPTAVIGTTVTGTDVSFHGAESFDADGTIVAYEWDLGDGSSAAGANPTHRYELPGDYPITLTVVDDDGLIGSTVSTITVAALPPTPGAPVAAFDARIADGRVTFDGSMSFDVDGEIVEWAWTFGDGSGGPDRIGPGSVVSHRYGRNGTFTAVLSVVAADGGTASASRTVTIEGVAEQPVVAPPAPGAPSPPVVTPSAGSPSPDVAGGDLPRTGSDPWRVARWGLLFLLIGWLALLGRRGLLLWRR